MKSQRYPVDEPALVRESLVPRYRQIEAAIRDQIWSGELVAGDQVPSEDELTRMFGVSRATVRQALAMLEQDGLIFREVGRGTFVKDIVEQLPQKVLVLSTDDLLDVAFVDSIVLHREGMIAARGEVQIALSVSFGAEVPFFVRTFFVDEKPIGGEKVYLHPRFDRKLSEKQMVSRNIVSTLSNVISTTAARFERRLGSVGADARSSVLFDTFLGAPLIAVHRTSYDVQGRPIEHSHMLFPSDRCLISLDG